MEREIERERKRERQREREREREREYPNIFHIRTTTSQLCQEKLEIPENVLQNLWISSRKARDSRECIAKSLDFIKKSQRFQRIGAFRTMPPLGGHFVASIFLKAPILWNPQLFLVKSKEFVIPSLESLAFINQIHRICNACFGIPGFPQHN